MPWNPRGILRLLSPTVPLWLIACATSADVSPPLVAPSPPRVETSRAYRLNRAPAAGALSGARVGDFAIANRRCRVVVAGLGGRRGGALVDAAASGGIDALRALVPVVGRETPLAPLQASIRLERRLNAAAVRVHGRDASLPQLTVETLYVLRPDRCLLEISTTLRNRGRSAVSGYQLADRIDFGASEPFVPGVGRPGSGEQRFAWIASWARDVAYAYFEGAGETRGTLSGARLTADLQRVDLLPGASVTAVRYLAVAGGGGVRDLLPALLEERAGEPSGKLRLTLLDEHARPWPHATLELRRADRPWAELVPGTTGAATLELPVGSYLLRARGEGRVTPYARVEVAERALRAATLRSGPPGMLVYDVQTAEGSAGGPITLAIEGVDPGGTPRFGPAFAARGSNVILSEQRQGTLALPPGRYRVRLGAGLDHTRQQAQVVVRPDGQARLTARLRRVVAPPGYVTLDTAQHVRDAPGCPVALLDRRLANRAAGLAVAALDTTLDTALEGGESAGVLELAAARRRTRDAGLVNVIARERPALPAPGLRPSRALAGDGRLLEWVDGERIVAAAASPPPATIDAVRLLDGGDGDAFDRRLQAWLALLARGRRITALAGSDALGLYEGGAARTFVAVPDVRGFSATDVIAGIRRGDAVISSGPFVELRVAGKGPGALVGGGAGKVTVEVTVHAPAWIPLDNLQLFLGARPWGKPVLIARAYDGVRLRWRGELPVVRDTFIVALVRGSGTLAPFGPPELPILGLTNPVWIDVDGNGRFDPPGN